MASCGFGVWIALDKKPQARLYHSITHEQIAEVDVSHPVTKMLGSEFNNSVNRCLIAHYFWKLLVITNILVQNFALILELIYL